MATSRKAKYTSSHSARSAISLISLLIVIGSLLPTAARAGVITDIIKALTGVGSARAEEAVSAPNNLQTMALMKPAQNIDPSASRGGGDITVVDGSALMPEEGPSGTIADIEKPKVSTVSHYIVREGDTLQGIAKMFGVSVNTILWANDLPRGSVLKVGQELIVLPITGLKYTVKKGDTLASIAKRYGADAGEIQSYNGLEGSALTVGTELIIPDGELAAETVPARTGSSPARNIGPAGTATQIGYYLRPLAGGTRTQGVHGYNGVDLAAPSGTPIVASAEGDVIVAKGAGWNGGYGEYVVIQHANGSQTLYSHASSIVVSVGQHVQQGQVIAYVGRTGKATGPHVHFEIRNGIRNPF